MLQSNDKLTVKRQSTFKQPRLAPLETNIVSTESKD